jgi:hypothetical protein
LNFVFFTDRDLGKRFPEILASAGLSVERHDDVFPPTCPDEEWLQYVGEHARVAITHNRRIRYMPNELSAVKRHRVALLVVVGKAPLEALAQNFVNTVPRIAAFLSGHEAPFIAKVYRPAPATLVHHANAPGSVTLWYPP